MNNTIQAERVKALRKTLQHAPSTDEVDKFLDYYGFHAERAVTTQCLIWQGCDARKQFHYFQNVGTGAPMMYVLPELECITVVQSEGNELVNLPKRWADALQQRAEAECNYN